MTLPRFAPGFTENAITGGGATSIPCDVPIGTDDGELLFGFSAWRGDGAHSLAGWTERVDNTQANGPSIGLYTKTAASEPASYTFNFSGVAARVLAFMARILGGTVEEVGSADGNGASETSMIAPSLTALGPERMLISLFVSTHTDLFTPPPSMEVFDSNNSGGGAAGIVRYNLCFEYVPAGATGTRTATIAIARTWSAVSMLIAPTFLGTPQRPRRSNYGHNRRKRGL
jgi:hypothetical protein